jgi:hypothetical protein
MGSWTLDRKIKRKRLYGYRLHSIQRADEAGRAEQRTEDAIYQAEEADLREQERQLRSLSIEQLGLLYRVH